MQCIAGEARVRAHQYDALYRRYHTGPGMELILEDGRHLTITRNHPVLSHARWLPAHALTDQHWVIVADTGDSVVHTAEARWTAYTTEYHPFRQHGDARSFHGDGSAGDIEVIIPSGGGERPDFRPRMADEGREPDVPADLVSELLGALCTPQAFGCSSWAQALNTVPMLDRHRADHGLSPAVVARLGDALDTLPPPVIDHDRLSVDMLGFRAVFALVRVARAERVELNRPVYNYATEHGCYTANGIVVANCS